MEERTSGQVSLALRSPNQELRANRGERGVGPMAPGEGACCSRRRHPWGVEEGAGNRAGSEGDGNSPQLPAPSRAGLPKQAELERHFQRSKRRGGVRSAGKRPKRAPGSE